MRQYAQGDVLFTLVRHTPKGVRELLPEQDRFIIARGEATGHHHSVAAKTCMLSLDEGGVMYLTVKQLTEVQHQEHGTIVLEPGTYRVDRQQEYGWEGWKQVQD